MQLTYFLLPAVATCLVSSAFSAIDSQDDKLVTMSVNNGEGLGKTSLSNRVQGIEDRLGSLEKGKGTRTDNPLHGYINVDFLYWKAQGNDQFYAFVSDNSAVIGNNQEVGKFQRAESDWKPGGRLSLGVSTVHDWNVGAIWTYYHNKSVSSKSSVDKAFSPIFLNVMPTRGVYHYRLNYNTVDLQFSSNCCLAKHVIFKPFIDARGAWIRYTDRMHYTGISPAIMGIPVDSTVVVKHEWLGFGPRVGAGAAYKFGASGFSFFGDFSGSLLYGNLHVKESIDQNVSIQNNEQTGPGNEIEWRDGYGDLKASLELMLGASYKWEFDHGKKGVCLHAAWETNYWWDQGDYFVTIVGVGNKGISISESNESLYLYGVNVGLGFDY